MLRLPMDGRMWVEQATVRVATNDGVRERNGQEAVLSANEWGRAADDEEEMND